MNEKTIIQQAESTHLRKLQIWSWYIKGAREMLLRLREHGLCDEPHNGDLVVKKSECKIYTKALLDLLMADKINIDRFLMEQYDIHYTDHERDKKGKLIKCRAYFAKKVLKYEEV